MATAEKRDLSTRAISPGSVKPDGSLTSPRSYGVYELQLSAGATRRYRLGNHPVRQFELEREFGSCKLVYLFRQRSDAVQMAALLNGREP